MCAAAVLQALVEPAKENLQVAMHIHAKAKGQDGSEQMEALMAAISSSGDPAKVGVLTKVRPGPAMVSHKEQHMPCPGQRRRIQQQMHKANQLQALRWHRRDVAAEHAAGHGSAMYWGTKSDLLSCGGERGPLRSAIAYAP